MPRARLELCSGNKIPKWDGNRVKRILKLTHFQLPKLHPKTQHSLISELLNNSGRGKNSQGIQAWEAAAEMMWHN